jgi:hypothetical protein
MISFFVAHWRKVRTISLTLLVLILIVAWMVPGAVWSGTFHPVFFIVGPIVLFTFTYGWPFLILVLDRFSLSVGFRKNSDWGTKFFLWVALVCFPLIIIDGFFSRPSPDILFGISASLGLISGCSHSLARTTKANKSAHPTAGNAPV